MPVFSDQLKREINLSSVPKRIISLVPSQTELLFDLGLDTEIIGITKFCVYPNEWFRNKTRIGGTKSINIEKIKALQPDLIVANKEENVKEQVEAISTIAPTWVSDIQTLEDALSMIKDIGLLTGTRDKSASIIATIQEEFSTLEHLKKANNKTLYLIWHKPWMSIGKGTFINDMLQRM